MQDVIITCKNCKALNNVSQGFDVIHHKIPFTCKGDKIYLTYFDCKECGTRHFVQIDNDSTLDKYKKCYGYMVRLSLSKRNNKPIKQSSSNEFKNMRAKLGTERIELARKYHGMMVYNEQNVPYKFELTITN